jgi:hypothetical protein
MSQNMDDDEILNDNDIHGVSATKDEKTENSGT